ncbi:MAG: ATP-binding protein [Candidatus Saccharibacteria bacterium]
MKPYYKLARHEGNKTLFDLVEMSIIATLSEEPLHIHAEGLRGTGKTTILRTARQILPKITRIKSCLYNCDPQKPHCPLHRDLTPDEVEALGTEEITMPFLEISHSAKVGTVAGSIDLAKITDTSKPQAALLPGIIPQAHRGIIFIDEINRLADTSPEITDILLDVMGNKPGRIQIEEAGMPVVDIPVNVSVWAASNPDEEPGPLEEIRRQLSDRFDMVFYMGRPSQVDVVANMLEESDNCRRNRVEDEQIIEEKVSAIAEKLAEMSGRYDGAEMPDFLRSFIARLYIKYSLESLRAIEAIQQGAILHSIIKNQKQVQMYDVLEVVPLALKHRVDGDTLVKIMNSLENKSSRDSILSFRDTKSSKDKNLEEQEEAAHFDNGGRRMRDISRNELIASERVLNPKD